MRTTKPLAERTPMMLPWLARRSGINIECAEALWQQALHETDRNGTAVKSSAFWKITVERLLQKIAAEAQLRRAAPFGFGALLGLPARLWLLGLIAGEALALAGTRRWRGNAAQHNLVH